MFLWLKSLKLTLIKLSSCGLLVCLLWRWWVNGFHNGYKTYTNTKQWALTANINSERCATSKHACEIVCSSTCALWNACHLPTHHAWDGVPAQTSARSSAPLHRAARCRFSWKMKCAAGYPRGTAGKGWKTKEGKHGNVSSDSTSQGTLTSSRENQNKNPLLAAKASTTGRWGRGGEVEGGRTMKPLSFPPDGCLLTAQSFCSARIRGHCCALRGCQTL